MSIFTEQIKEVIKDDIQYQTGICTNPEKDERERLIAASKVQVLESVLLLLEPKED